MLGSQAQKYTNIYIKNFGEDISEDKLYEMFSEYGKITSHKIMCDEGSGKNKGFGFVAFEKHEDAEKVI